MGVGRTRVEIGSQNDPLFLSKLADKYRPAIVIDDGSHEALHIALTFRHLFPRLEPAGCYVIEDINFRSSGGAPGRPSGALASLLDLAGRVAQSNSSTQHEDFIASSAEMVDRIEFVQHAALIWKKALPENPTAMIRSMHELVKRSDSEQNWFHFIHFILKHGGSLELAEHAARRAIELGHDSAVGLAYWRLSDVVARRGDLDGALDAAQQALKHLPHQAEIHTMVDRFTAAIHARSS